MSRSPLSGALMTLGSMSAVQLGLAVSVHLFDDLGPYGTAGLRLGCAAVLMLVLVRPRPSRFNRKDLLTCLALGVVTACLMLFFMGAIARIPLGTASALEFLGPLSVALVGAKGKHKAWALLAAAGVVLLTEPWHGGTDLVGIGLALCSACSWAVYILLTQRVGDRVTGLDGIAVSITVAAIISLPITVPGGFDDVTWQLALVGFAIAALHPVIPFSLELLALRRLTAAAFGTLMSLEPGLAVVIGLVLLGQVPSLTAAVGVAFVVAAGIAATRAGARPHAETGCPPAPPVSSSSRTGTNA